jgi:hypothetical protein
MAADPDELAARAAFGPVRWSENGIFQLAMGPNSSPSGVSATTNAATEIGNRYQVRGRRPGEAVTSTSKAGAMGGAWNRLATVRRGQVFSVEMDRLGGRAITGLAHGTTTGTAVGQGGWCWNRAGARGSSWHFVETKLGRDVGAI